MSQNGMDAPVRAQTFDTYTQRMSLDATLGPLLWPRWMLQHRLEQSVRSSEERL